MVYLVIEEIVKNILQSLLVSSLYALGALSLTLSYRVTKIANFAVSEYVTLGAYTAALSTLRGIDPYTSLIIASVLIGLLAVMIDEAIYKPLYKKGSTPLQLLIASIATMLMIRYLWSIYADYRGILFLSSGYSIAPIIYLVNSPLTNLHILSLSILVIISLALYMLLFKTRIGKAMRALASNPELAAISGIPVWRIRRITWFISGVLAGLMGGLWAYYTSIHTESGWRLLLWIFASSIIGGIKSIPLTIAGAFIIGFSENLGIWFANRFFGVDTAYKPIIAYIAIFVSLIVGRSKYWGR